MIKGITKYLIFGLALLVANVAFAADAATAAGLGTLGKGIGVGIGIFGAGYGIGKIGQAVLEGISRNPSAAGKMNTPFFVGVALIEGALILGIVLGFR